MMKVPRTYATLQTVAFLMAMVSSCYRESSYPTLLIEADSLLMNGQTDSADSLLACYDSRSQGSDESAILYRRLLDLEEKYIRTAISEDDFSVADTLVRYYSKREDWGEKYGKALLFLGDVYRAADDSPAAIKRYLEAENVCEGCGNLTLLGWTYNCLGSLYMEIGLLDECKAPFRKFYDVAFKSRDTLRMAYASRYMGHVFAIENKPDSTIYYYKQTVELGQYLPDPSMIVPYAEYDLCDIYIQTGQFDKASEMMTYDTLNWVNIAYWHLGQDHLDSAAYYFHLAKPLHEHFAQAEILKRLAEIEGRKGNSIQSLDYYVKMMEVEDSAKAALKQDEAGRTQLQYNYANMKEDRDQIENERRLQNIYMKVLVALFIFIGGAYYYYELQKRHKVVEREKLLRQQEEAKYRQSMEQLEENKKKIVELERLHTEAKHSNDIQASERLKLDISLLSAENQAIEANKDRREYLKKKFEESKLYLRLTIHAGDPKYNLKDEEWDQLANEIDEAYQQFTKRLLSITKLSDQDLKVCYLAKLGIQPAAMAVMLSRSRSSITMTRKRLYQKITGQEGSPKDFDSFIERF